MIGLMAAAVLTASSQVTEVTVYNDRAQVVRTAELEVEQGINSVVFEDLPQAIDARGIQVVGAGDATVLDVRFKKVNRDEVDDETWQALYDQRDALREDEKRLNQRIQRLADAKSFMGKISQKLTHSADKEGDLELDPEKWAEMLELHAARNAEYDAGIQEADKDLKHVRDALQKVEADIRDAGAVNRKQRCLVEVDLEVNSTGAVVLDLSYLVTGPSWKPTYDVRVDSESRRMEMKYFALVRQNTGEDWGDVNLKLSTARPGLGGEHPELPVWRINVKPDPRVVATHRYTQDYSVETGQRTAPVVRPQDWGSDAASRGILSSMGGTPALMARAATSTTQGTAVLFDVQGSSEIESDNVEHRVAIASLELPAFFRYSCVPKLDKYVYLKARGVNVADYPLLMGSANVYLDGSYVATSELDFVAPGEDFWAFLGVDESMKVEYKLINKHQSREGLTGRTTRHTYEYLFKVKNTHVSPEELIIFDQLPISENEDIEVELEKPRYSGDSDALEINDEQRIKWFLVLDPGEERDVPFTFYVDAPKDVEIAGLE